MNEKPILFSGPLVRAILEGRKTQTRRVFKPQPRVDDRGAIIWNPSSSHPGVLWRGLHPQLPKTYCPYGQPGDRLWVRETHCSADMGPLRDGGPVAYAADYGDDGIKRGPWRPSIHMPRWASRIDLEVTGVRVERVQDIGEGDAVAEGCGHGPGCASCASIRDDGGSPARDRFAALWDEINGPRGFGWEANPWVWVVEFRRVRP